MHIKFLLAAGAVLTSVGVAQAQDQQAAEFVSRWEDAEVDSSFDGEDAVRDRLAQHAQSNVTSPVQPYLTSKASRAALGAVSHWQDDEVDSAFDTGDVASYGAGQLVQSNVTSKGEQFGMNMVSRWQDDEVDSSFSGDGND